MAEREELRAEITLDDRKFQEGAKRTENRVGTLMKWIAGIGAVVAVGVAAWKLYNKATKKTGDDVVDLGRKLGMTAQQMKQIKALATESKQAFAPLAGSFREFRDRLGAGIQTNAAFKQGMKELGIETFKSTQPFNRFIQIIKAASKVKDEFVREGALQKVLGPRAGALRGITGLGEQNLENALLNASRAVAKMKDLETKIAVKVPVKKGGPERLERMMDLFGKASLLEQMAAMTTPGLALPMMLRQKMLAETAMGAKRAIPGPLGFRGQVPEDVQFVRPTPIEDTLGQILGIMKQIPAAAWSMVPFTEPIEGSY